MYINYRLIATLLLGFSAGLPLALITTALQAWFAVSGVDIVTIGLLGFLGQPYVYKFLWSPLLDRYVPPLLGRRRGWILLAQVGLIIGIATLALFNPQHSPAMIGIIAFLIAFTSASQDICIDAYRTDTLLPSERGIGNALYVAGFRVGVLFSGGLGLVIADQFGWRITYLVLSLAMGIGLIATMLGPEPERKITPPNTLYAAVIEPFREFMSRRNAVALLALIVLYKLGDAFSMTLTTTFLIRALHFSLTTIGSLTKIIGLVATVSGALLGGVFMTRIGLYRALIFFGILQGLSNFTYMILAMVGKNLWLMSGAFFIDNFCSGLGTTAFLALLTSLCHPRYSATQFALFTALSAIGRVYVGPMAGLLVAYFGWVHFFFITTLFALPGLAILWFLQKEIQEPVCSTQLVDNTA